MERGEAEKVQVGELAELSEEVQWDERVPRVLRRAHLIVGEALLGVEAVVVDHEVARVRACDHLVIVVAADLARSGV